VENLTCTDELPVPTRCLASCADASVRIVSPQSGDIITTFLISRRRRLVSAAYAPTEGLTNNVTLLL